jgi:hypothetical protein
VLNQYVKEGVMNRPETTDAAMLQQVDCEMLKGRFLRRASLSSPMRSTACSAITRGNSRTSCRFKRGVQHSKARMMLERGARSGFDSNARTACATYNRKKPAAKTALAEFGRPKCDAGEPTDVKKHLILKT